jgi:hypothetical protein
MRKLYGLFDNCRIAGALIHVLPTTEIPRKAVLVDSAGRAS